MSLVSADTLTAPTGAGVATSTIPSIPVTRTEIADSLDAAFDAGPTTRPDLIDAARTAGARLELVSTLEQLPTETQFGHLRQLWAHLPHVPIEA